MQEEVEIFSLPTYFLSWNSLWVPSECLLELGAGVKQAVRGWRKEEGALRDPLEMGHGEKVATVGCLL